MKKQLITSLILLIIVSVSAYAVSTQIAYRQDVRVTLINQEPDPAEPGDYVDLRFKFENYGAEKTGPITVHLQPTYPFSLYNEDDREKVIGSLQSRQLGDTGIIVKYRIRVDKNAIEGPNEFKLRYKLGTDQWIVPEEFEIAVRTQDAILSVEEIELIPDTIKPGSEAKIRIHLKNLADSLLKDIKTKLALDDISLATLKSSDEKTIKWLDGNKEVTVEFDLVADPDAESDLYVLPIDLSYFDEVGNAYNKTIKSGIFIGAAPDITTNIDSTTIHQAGTKGEVTFKFVNKGVTDIKFMNIILKESDAYNILSTPEDYLGNIDSDDYESADFDIYVKSTTEKKVTFPITIEYKDANNNEYKDTVQIDMPLYNKEEAKKFGFAKGNGYGGIIFIIILAVVGFFGYRWWKKRKNNKKK